MVKVVDILGLTLSAVMIVAIVRHELQKRMRRLRQSKSAVPFRPYDLESEIFMLSPVQMPIRNRIPRHTAPTTLCDAPDEWEG